MKNFFINNIIRNTKVEGPGIRHAIWFQGCEHACEGCFAQHTWDILQGNEYSVDYVAKELEDCVDGLTISGGEPFLQKESLNLLLKKINVKSIILFTGFTFEELLESEDQDIYDIIGKVDVLITGRFIKDLVEKKRPFAGSENQRFWFLTDFYSWEDFKNINNSIEIRIKSNGEILVNGMENSDNINLLAKAKNRD
jgi:anaerobic ribonucleoside-triphosphate reductase activating protein